MQNVSLLPMSPIVKKHSDARANSWLSLNPSGEIFRRLHILPVMSRSGTRRQPSSVFRPWDLTRFRRRYSWFAGAGLGLFPPLFRLHCLCFPELGELVGDPPLSFLDARVPAGRFLCAE